MSSIPFQLPLRRAFPTVYGPLDYREEVAPHKRIDEILRRSGVKDERVAKVLSQANGRITEKVVARVYHAFRCAVAMRLSGSNARKFSVRLADSVLLQWFAYSEILMTHRASSKSSLDRYLKMFDECDLANAIDQLTLQAAEADPEKRPGRLNEPLALDDVFADCTWRR